MACGINEQYQLSVPLQVIFTQKCSFRVENKLCIFPVAIKPEKYDEKFDAAQKMKHKGMYFKSSSTAKQATWHVRN